MDITYRPLDVWPGEETPAYARRRSNFSSGWGATEQLLDRELEHLGASRVLFLVDIPPSDFRIRDGKPKASARWGHPGCVLSFESIHGPLKYACDTFDAFPDNVRAIALGLEALRKVERYGITKRGEQYRGWSQLPSGTAMGERMSNDEAWRVLCDLSGSQTIPPRSSSVIVDLYRQASKLHHPDQAARWGRVGDSDLFRRATEARDVLLGAS